LQQRKSFQAIITGRSIGDCEEEEEDAGSRRGARTTGTAVHDVLQDLSSRRKIFRGVFFVAVASAAAAVVEATVDSTAHAASSPSDDDLDKLLDQVRRAKEQLGVVPKLIESGKWDAVRAVLIEPPLSDCWAKTGRPPLLKRYAEALGDSGRGDELAALELKEDIADHLRFLDMAVYNNNFNPISVEGETGASKELIRSYYEDPMNEYKASTTALNEIINLSST